MPPNGNQARQRDGGTSNNTQVCGNNGSIIHVSRREPSPPLVQSARKIQREQRLRRRHEILRQRLRELGIDSDEDDVVTVLHTPMTVPSRPNQNTDSVVEPPVRPALPESQPKINGPTPRVHPEACLEEVGRGMSFREIRRGYPDPDPAEPEYKLAKGLSGSVDPEARENEFGLKSNVFEKFASDLIKAFEPSPASASLTLSEQI